MKIFISHKNTDSTQAEQLKTAFAMEKVDAYLDVLDETTISDAKSLTEHIKQQLNNCSDIIVLLSQNTKSSWWVPFEIGMAAQIDMPTVSFLKDSIDLPSYLSYWPRLRSIDDIKTYVKVRKTITQELNESHAVYTSTYSKKLETETFYKKLKEELR